MLPDWMKKAEEYEPLSGGNSFAVKSIKTIGKAMSRIQIQRGHEKGRALPPLFKLFLVIGGILLVSITQKTVIVMAAAACVLLYLCIMPSENMAEILKAAVIASLFTALILLPAVIMNHSLVKNEIFIVVKVFISIVSISIFNHTTQWNHITKALRQLHVPGLFVFTLDMTLKYIVLLGNLIVDLLTSLQFRSVGKNNKKYASIGGVMGITFIRGAEINTQMYEAMQCRGFTDDYRGL